MQSRFSKKEIEELQELKDKLIDNCKIKDCEEFGLEENKCQCFKLFIYLKELYYSKIPREYWVLSLKELQVEDLYKRYVKKYLVYLDNGIKEGLGIIFSGEKRGIGKTSLMSVIGKNAIIKGYKVFYTIAQNIIDSRFSDVDDVLERIEQCDLFLLDELDKVTMKEGSNIPKILENLLRGLLPNKKAILIGTNYIEEEIEESFGIISFLSRYVKILSMEGKDYSKKIAKNWEKRLKRDDIEFNNEQLIKEAEKYYKFNRK